MKTQVIKSELYGELHVKEDQIYNFNPGIVGFPHIDHYAILPLEDTELFVLQTLEDEFSLLLIPALQCANEVSFYIDDQTVSHLGVTQSDEVAVFFVLRFIDGVPFINRKAPILLVPTTKKGCQYVIHDDSLDIREPLVLKGDMAC